MAGWLRASSTGLFSICPTCLPNDGLDPSSLRQSTSKSHRLPEALTLHKYSAITLFRSSSHQHSSFTTNDLTTHDLRITTHQSPRLHNPSRRSNLHPPIPQSVKMVALKLALPLLLALLPSSLGLAIPSPSVILNKETNADRLAKGLGPLPPSRRSTGPYLPSPPSRLRARSGPDADVEQRRWPSGRVLPAQPSTRTRLPTPRTLTSQRKALGRC